jgi:hypothetical protein
MNPAGTVTSSSVEFKKISVSESALLLALSAAVPPLVHLLPSWDLAPLGAHLLPMFWMTFVAAYLFGARVGAVAGLFAPAVNLLLTGLPAWRHLSVLSCELIVFSVGTAWAVRRFPRFWLLAPLGYVVAKLFSTGVQAATGVFGDIGAPLAFFQRSLGNAVAGLIVLAAINFTLVRVSPKKV